jgi:hypothetical protein
MNFKTFIYYCAICGGWAALLTWALQQAAGMQSVDGFFSDKPMMKSAVIGGLLGLLLGGVIGMLDAILNSVGFQRIMRVGICLILGLAGGFISAFIGEGLFRAFGPKFLGWSIVGMTIGAAIGVFDLLRASAGGKGFKQAIRKTVNAVIGGTIGGFIGGFLNDAFGAIPMPPGGDILPVGDTMKDAFPKFTLAVGLVILGMCIGLLIGTVQVLLKEAWVRVEKGFKSGKEMMLTKPETTVGRAEGSDIALFGDMQVEKTHARIVLKGDRYILIDSDTPGGTTVNSQRISGPTPLSNGDMIGCGNSLVRFQEKAKR